MTVIVVLWNSGSIMSIPIVLVFKSLFLIVIVLPICIYLLSVPHIDGDPTAEVSHVSLRISSVSCVLLHKVSIVLLSFNSSS